jgi:hypothetical protein
MAKISQHAVVLGASIAGLLAARVLADVYQTVTVVDRDDGGDDPAPGRGVPQGRHLHALTAGGAQIMGALFPGLLEELVAAGVPVWDDGDMSMIDISGSGHRLSRSGTVGDSQAMAIYYPNRPFLECHVRRRLRAVANVTLLPGHDIAELTSTAQRDRVTRVRLVSRDGQDTSVAADLVIDATGRGSRMPVFLENLGYGRPSEDEVAVRLAYASQAVWIPPGLLREHIVAAFPQPGRHTLMALCRNENDISMFTIGGMLGEEPPTDSAGMAAFAEQFAPAPRRRRAAGGGTGRRHLSLSHPIQPVATLRQNCAPGVGVGGPTAAKDPAADRAAAGAVQERDRRDAAIGCGCPEEATAHGTKDFGASGR